MKLEVLQFKHALFQLISVEGIKGAHSKAVYGHNNIGLRKDFMKQNPTASL